VAEIRTVTTLRRKREEIRRTIVAYEEKLDQAKADLSHVSAAIAIFEGATEGCSPRPYVDTDRLFARGEPTALARAALEANGPMDTRELVQSIMAAKGLNTGDKVLCKAIAFRLIHSLRTQCSRGRLVDAGMRRGVRVWAMPGQGDNVLPFRDG